MLRLQKHSNYHVTGSLQIKRQLKKIYNIRRHMSTPRAFECHYFKIILNLWHSPFKTIYYSLFHCHLLYCPNIISTSSQTNLSRISLLQRKAIRIISNANHCAQPHQAPLSWTADSSLWETLLVSRVLFMHSIEYTYCSPYLSNIWTKNQGRNAGIYLYNANEYTIPPARKEFFRRFPFYYFPPLGIT